MLIYPDEIDRDFSQLPFVVPWAGRAVLRLRVGLFVPALGAARSRYAGVWFRSIGGKDGHAGVIHQFS